MKSANLKILQKLGYNVPRFTIIPSSVFSSVYESYLHSFAIGDGHTPDQFDNFISRVELDEVSKIINKINFSPKYQTWAIRSSSSMEDSSKYSFAGLFESKLDVNTADILKSVREVYLSLFSNRVEAYLVENNINNRNLNMSIIIQEFIPGDISGVMFSIAGNQPDKIAISVTQGLGDKLVSGQIEGEYYLIDRNQEQINISIAPYISIDQLNELRKTILLLENAFESLLDVEFTYKDGILYLLQVRPITVFPSTGIVKRTFDNSNIIESYKGPTTPLTYSVATRSYAKVYYLFLKNMGVKQSILKSNDETFDNLIVYLSGNIYYNLNNWHAGLQLLPGYEYNKEYMDTMMGLGEKFELEKTNKNLAFMYKENKPPGKLNQLIYRPIHNIRLGVNIFKHHRKLEKEIRYFMDDFKKKMEMLTSLNIHTLSIEEIIEIDTYVYQEITSKWFAPILNDFFLMIYFGIFKKLNEKWIDTPRYNELLSGNSDLLSLKPTVQLLKITNLLLEENIDVNGLEDAQLLEKLKFDGKSYSIEYNDFIQNFGDRTFDELKLETLNLEDNPQYILDIIRFYVKNNSFASSSIIQEQKIRTKKLEVEILESIKGRVGLLFSKRKLYSKFYHLTHQAIHSREDMRFARTEIYGFARKLFLRLGTIFTQLELLSDPRDIFYLTIDEIKEYNSGSIITGNIKELVTIRKMDQQIYNKITLPERIVTFGAVPNDFAKILNETKKEELGDLQLKGTGCFGGIVEGRAVKLIDPNEIIPEGMDILIAERTDPAWTPLFIKMKGILVERGSPLSHSAIVAREFGIPTIVGIKNLMNSIETGQIIKMNAFDGVVEVIS